VLFFGNPQVRRWLALAPALAIIGILIGTSLVYGIAQSLGYLTIIGETTISLAAYETLLFGNSEYWVSLAFSLWVSLAATLLAGIGALLIAALLNRQQPQQAGGLWILNLNLAFPHLVWAVALVFIFAQSGFLARIAASVGLISSPAQFPVIVRDRYGIGIILHYVSKEIPFLVLIVLATLRTQGSTFELVAANLGATFWQRLRWVTLPLVWPGLSAGAAVVFAYIFGAYEVPALLGVRYPRMLAGLALEFFANPDLNRRAEGMAISLLIALITLIMIALGRWLRREPV
jgi:putative spermidine/putrescine transport system permease protein